MVFNVNGDVIADKSPQSIVSIKDLKVLYPNDNDDQLFETAITLAQQQGGSAKIIWDGTDIHFTGRTIHNCLGFGGIDFNGSHIYMPDYDGVVIISIKPSNSQAITVDASDILARKTTNSDLINRVFCLNNNQNASDGNVDMLLGTRMPSDAYSNSVVYWTPCLKTSEDGLYETGELFITPNSGTVTCTNVHEYPQITFEICNGIIVSSETANMTKFATCFRSNVHLHHFVVENRSNIATYHDGVFGFTKCCDIEVDHISGINPVQEQLTSGYLLSFSSVTHLHVHDVSAGDSISWGAIGSNHLMNTLFERCQLNRWDCHYCQTGYNVIKDSVLCQVHYGVGNGTIIVDNCTFRNYRVSSEVVCAINNRDDLVGIYDGDIIVRDSVFYRGEQPANLYAIWKDVSLYKKPSNSVLNSSPKAIRRIERCQITDECKHVFLIGTNQASDIGMYENVYIRIKDCEITCSDTLIESKGANQTKIKSILVDRCVFNNQCYIVKLLSNTPINVSNCDFGSNSIKIVSSQSEMIIIGNKISEITSDQNVNKVIANGNIISGSQTVSNFITYAFSGNIANDMDSVNKHSN